MKYIYTVERFSTTFGNLSSLISSVLSRLYLSTHADRQGVDISFTVCLCFFVCVFVRIRISPPTITLAASTFCSAVQRRSRQGITNFCELCSPRSPKAYESAIARATPSHPNVNITVEMGRRKFRARDAPFVEFNHVCNISRVVWT